VFSASCLTFTDVSARSFSYDWLGRRQGYTKETKRALFEPLKKQKQAEGKKNARKSLRDSGKVRILATSKQQVCTCQYVKPG